MSREWKEEEATESLGFLYECLVGNTDNSAIQVPVALDGVTVATSVGGAAASCIGQLGGLTLDQLRWMFSGATDQELVASGWDPLSLKNSDGDPSTRLWSEIDERCEAVEVLIAGPNDKHGTYDFFLETVLAGDESFDENHYFESEHPYGLVSFLKKSGAGIAFMGFSNYYQNKEHLAAAAIKNKDEKFVAPTEETIGDSSYALSRKIYMNLLNHEVSLADTVPFVTFGLRTGETLIATTGYVAIPAMDTQAWIETLNSAPYVPAQGDNRVLSGAEIAYVVIGVIVFLFITFFVFRRVARK